TQDAAFDRVLTEAWSELVEEIIPVGISHLFLFDGEKIEGFADLENSAELLSRAVHSLLGLDIVDRLASDLLVLERRKRAALKNDLERSQLDDAQAEVERLEQLRAELFAQRGSAKNAVERRQNDLRRIDHRFRSEGGEIYEQGEQLESRR